MNSKDFERRVHVEVGALLGGIEQVTDMRWLYESIVKLVLELHAESLATTEEERDEAHGNCW